MSHVVFSSLLIEKIHSGVFICSTHIVCNVVLLSMFSAVQDLEESFTELIVEGGVDDRVEGTVDISKPCGSTVQLWGDVASFAMSIQYVCQKEWQPADYESP